MDHRRRRNEINRRTERDLGGEAMIGDVRAVEKGEIVGAGLDALEGVIGIVRVELEPAVLGKERCADRAAKVEIEPAGPRPTAGRSARPGRGTPPQRMTPDDLMRSTIAPAWAAGHEASATAIATPSAGVVLRDARFAGSSGRGLCVRPLAPNLVLRSDAKQRVSKDDSSSTARFQLYAGSVAGSELNPSGIAFGIPWRTSSGVIPIASQPLPP